MFDPTLEILVLPTAPKVFAETLSDSGFEDQYLAWRNQSYGFLMTQLLSSHSTTEVEVARQILLDQLAEAETRYSRFYEDAYTYVTTPGGETWVRLFKDDLYSERLTMIGADELCLAHRFAGLLDRVDEAYQAAHEREDRAYPARSAGRFARAS